MHIQKKPRFKLSIAVVGHTLKLSNSSSLYYPAFEMTAPCYDHSTKTERDFYNDRYCNLHCKITCGVNVDVTCMYIDFSGLLLFLCIHILLFHCNTHSIMHVHGN